MTAQGAGLTAQKGVHGHRLIDVMTMVLLIADGSRAAEIEPYRLTGVDGHVTLQYVRDDQTTTQTGVTAPSRLRQSGFRNEIFAMTHSYIYHPNLMTLDLGGGPILHGESFSGDSGDTRARGALFNFSARATVLRDKPYTGSVFFSHLNPTVSVSPGEIFTQENTRYGFDASLLAAASPVPVQVAFTHSHSQGRGADRQVDDRTGQFNFGARRSYGDIGTTQFQFQSSSQSSQSGSQNLPIQSSTSNSQAINFDTRLQFGDARQYDFTHLVSINRQNYALGSGELPELKDERVMFDLRTRHADSLQSQAAYSFGHSRQGELDSVTQAASAGLNYWPEKGLETSLGIRGDGGRTRQFITRSQGVDGSIRIEQPLPAGTGQASYGMHYDSRAQQALSSRTTVLGEHITMNGLTTVALARPHVIGGSPVISNASRSQTYVAGIDYIVSVVGTETRLQRLIGGRILDGESLLADYDYDVGGTYAYHQLDQTLNLNWNISRSVNGYFRYFSSSPQLASGSPGFPLNAVRSTLYGVRADLQFSSDFPITMGGGVEFENRQESVAPYRRRADDYYLQSAEPLLGLGSLRASMRRSRIEYAAADQDSNLRVYELRYWSRHWYGMDITAALSMERDTAGIVQRHRSDGTIGVQWQERKFSLTSSLVRTQETQAGVDRRRTTFQFLAKRDF